MHELSIATALVQLADRFRPPRARVRAVHVEAGPLQSIDPHALQWAWQVASEGTAYRDAELILTELPWQLKCPQCGRRWQTKSLEEICSCGSNGPIFETGDELILTHLDVADEASGLQPDSAPPCATT